ncbi:septal ring factor EnvC (AmiA/AmiB activator) [Parabacteroides sp. PF5-5]|uniref:murein hydrolase activator EnvC family protein n=1 Tax=unclassified Parabacteroides TaxID=2649774 RepID=UPI002473CDC6|nr:MULTISPECIES: peptidoglycan DD-metalloendopeptidase family protein [unclassified Parabacteroides]MDH6303457.1 septal ring factor EnvC (AmiA/AmiB activator) [Parabacteroides sp. PH5-39]MDH6314779.1 septal ring factor EnvC (AmiA/AmiB activator) [Parabacteroides sp. PF5-13]MDH6318116.1 septal ring factor EnvC (AmiA/AmiB activator) [Parabacteroides sp. PH5-13]MDH6321952.1 septal ring factor EnvC (AmiA/AmiB activator) [Parabacteroides sp. PH5-8]MDH6326076.1 septal ring factor EnvC (AmiA/AmiB act
MRYAWIVILCLCSTVALFGQKSAKVRELENQRKAALAEIAMTNQLLAETKKSAQNSLSRLNLLSQQILQRKKVISLLNQEVAFIDKEILALRGELSELEKDLGDKRDNYGMSVRNIQRRNSSQDKLLFILSADNFSQSLRRIRYLREYADWQKEQAGKIVVKQQEVNTKREELEASRIEKQVLLHAREQEHQNLQTEEADQKREVEELNKKQKQLQADLKKKQRQADALNRQIEKQIAEEIARAEAEARAAREREQREREKALAQGKKAPEPKEDIRKATTKGGYAMTKEERKLSDNFAGNKGRLPMPVSGTYSIVSTYGKQKHPNLKYVEIENSGIDIQTTASSDARAVFNGEVTSVFKVDGYNNSVIIRHGNYLTVYSNLVQVYVKIGQKVSTRQSIGKIYTDTDNDNTTILHFEMRKERDKENPLSWLAR